MLSATLDIYLQDELCLLRIERVRFDELGGHA